MFLTWYRPFKVKWWIEQSLMANQTYRFRSGQISFGVGIGMCCTEVKVGEPIVKLVLD